jgi:Ca-activated chloride channel family protein
MIKNVAIALLISSMFLPFGGRAHRKTEEGNARYLDGLYDEALRSYTEAQVDAPEAPQLYYDIGNVLYRQGDFEGAAEAFERALLASPDEMVADAAYNLGNARFRQQAFKEAVEAYQRSLGAAPDDREAKRNLELALRALQEQQQQQQQQEDQQQDQQGEEPQNEQPQSDQSDEEREDRQQDRGRSPQGEQGQETREPLPGQMTEEQAARLLDTLAEKEKETLRQKAREKVRGGTRRLEKDW